MNKLEQARTQIDAIDREMAKLYEARLDAVKDVIAYKIENDLPILDSGREQVVMKRICSLFKIRIIKNIMSLL